MSKRPKSRGNRRLTAAKSAYIPDITAFARQSYQDGVPFLVHNFGTFGVNLSFPVPANLLGNAGRNFFDAASLYTARIVNPAQAQAVIGTAIRTSILEKGPTAPAIAITGARSLRASIRPLKRWINVRGVSG